MFDPRCWRPPGPATAQRVIRVVVDLPFVPVTTERRPVPSWPRIDLSRSWRPGPPIIEPAPRPVSREASVPRSLQPGAARPRAVITRAV